MARLEPQYAALYRELITSLYGMQWRPEDELMPIDIIARLWQPKLELDLSEVNAWVTLLTYGIYTKPELFDDVLHARSQQLRQVLLHSPAYKDANPSYVRISHPRVQAERHFHLLTRSWADELRFVSEKEMTAAGSDDDKMQRLQARIQLGRHLMNFSTDSLITESILGYPQQVAENESADKYTHEWLSSAHSMKEIRKHMRTLALLVALLKTIPVYDQLSSKHLEELNFDPKKPDRPFFAHTELPKIKP